MSADEMCGDYPAPCNCDDPETHDGAVTAADRPSVTDNARADLHPVVTEHQIIGTQTGKQGAGQVVPEDSVLCIKCGWMRCSDYTWHLSDALAAGRAETTTGAIARGEALAAGDPDWMNVTRWPRTEAEATTTILRLIEENRNLRTTVDADLEYQRRLEARLAAVEALADEWERTEAYRCTNAGECPRCLAYQSAVIRVRAALAAPTDTTKETGR